MAGAVEDFPALVHELILNGDPARGSALFLCDALRAYEKLYGPRDSIVLTANLAVDLHGWAETRQNVGRVKFYLELAEKNPGLFPDYVVEREEHRRLKVRFTKRRARPSAGAA